MTTTCSNQRQREVQNALATIICLAVASGCGGQQGTEESLRPDILLVVVDSLRRDHLHCYGYSRDTSPTLDRLAREGVLFKDCTSTTSWTLPSHAALFTGLNDLTHGVTDETRRLGAEHVTLAEILRDSGYQTASFYGAPFLHPCFGLDQGFDVYESYIGDLWEGLDDDEFNARLRAGRLGAVGEVTGPRAVEEVDSWLDEADQAPFFLFVHLWDVHHDYIPPQEYLDLFDPGYAGDLDASRLVRNPAVHPNMAARDLYHLVAAYDGEIRFTDDNFALILDSLERHGRLQNTIVVFTADHGDEFFEHNGIGHRRTLFDEVLGVPLVVWGRGIPGGREVEAQVRLTDVMPTLLSLAGVPSPVETQGRDLVPFLRGESLEPTGALLGLGQRIVAIRTDSHKLIRNRSGLVRGYDLQADPEEQNPLPPGNEHIAALLRQLEALTAEAGRFRGGIGSRGSEPSQVDPAIQRRLEALGYAGDDDE